VLLDIKLPRMNGIEVLSRIKSDERTKCIPVVMFTSSREDCDMRTCYNIGANAYIVKPFDFQELMKVLKYTENFWCHANETI
jgi:two-component system response regulator